MDSYLACMNCPFLPSLSYNNSVSIKNVIPKENNLVGGNRGSHIITTNQDNCIFIGLLKNYTLIIHNVRNYHIQKFLQISPLAKFLTFHRNMYIFANWSKWKKLKIMLEYCQKRDLNMKLPNMPYFTSI